jgi:hypothetical protein
LQVAQFTVKRTVHLKKSFSIFPSPAKMSLSKLSFGGNNLYMTTLFPPRESVIPAGDGNIEKLSYGVPTHWHIKVPVTTLNT